MTRPLGFAATVFTSLLAALLLASPSLGQGCAMCASYVGSNEDPLGAALNMSILFLLSMPFVLGAGVGLWFVYLYWQGRARTSSLPLTDLQKEGTS